MSQHHDAYRDFAESVESELGDSLERLVLFGSVARGEESEESDVDVLIVVESEDKRDIVENLAFEVSVKHGVFLVPLIKTSEEFNRNKDSMFLRDVLDTGEIYV